MKYVGFMFILWGVGYFMAMQVTVKPLPTLPCMGFFVVGFLLLGLGFMRDGGKR